MKTNRKLWVCGVLFAAVLSSCVNNNNESMINSNVKAFEEILQNRRSIRAYSDQKIADEQMLKIFWAANGINREDGKRTAPSAVNAQDIQLYLCNDEGAFYYNAQGKQLEKISDTDIRPIIADHNKFVVNLPVVLLMSDQSKFARFGEGRAFAFGAMDAGYVSQNICLYCAAAGLATVPCAPPIDAVAVQSALQLPSTMLPLIYHPVGYPATQ